MEKIADIVAEMRTKTAKSKEEAWYDKRKWERLCNRIEMAWEREAKAIATETAVLPAVCITKPVGNAAMMREELMEIQLLCWKAGVTMEYAVACGIIKAKSRAALAAPPRNCDLFATLDDARNAFFADYVPDETCSSATAFATWLFDEAKGEAK